MYYQNWAINRRGPFSVQQQHQGHATYILVVFTLPPIIRFVVPGQAPVTLELRNTSRKKHKQKVVHAYITADAVHAILS